MDNLGQKPSRVSLLENFKQFKTLLLSFLNKNIYLTLAFVCLLFYAIFKNVKDVSFDSLWYVAYVKAYPLNYGEFVGGIANHFFHPRHIIYNPISLLGSEFLRLLYPNLNYYSAMQYISALLGSVCVYLFTKICKRFYLSKITAILLSLIFAFSYVIVWNATIPEVYIHSVLVYLIIFIFYINNISKLSNYRSAMILALLNSLGILTHIQFIPLLAITIFYLFLTRKDMYNWIGHTIAFLTIVFLIVIPVYTYLGFNQWNAKNYKDILANVHEINKKPVNYAKLLSLNNLNKSMVNLGQSIVGVNSKIKFITIVIGWTILIMNIYLFYTAVKNKDKLTVLGSTTFFMFLILLHMYEEEYTAGAWLKLWTLATTQTFINLIIFIRYKNNILNTKQSKYLYILAIIFLAYTIKYNVLHYSFLGSGNKNFEVALKLDHELNNTDPLYVDNDNDDIFNLYQYAVTKADRVHNIPLDTSTIPDKDFYILSRKREICKMIISDKCERIVNNNSKFMFNLYSVNTEK